MSADWSKPTTASAYSTFVTELDNRLDDLALMFDGLSPTNLPTNAIRFNSTTKVFEKWNGSTWSALDTGYVLQAGDTMTGQLSIAHNHATEAALKVYQTGAGNALEVGDSTDPDSTPFVIDAAGSVIAGHTATVTGQSGITSAKLQVYGVGGGPSTIILGTFGATAGQGPRFQFNRSRNTTVGSHTAVTDGDELMEIGAGGSDGSAFQAAGILRFEVDGTVSAGIVPAKFTLQLADSTGTLTARMRGYANGQSEYIGTMAMKKFAPSVTEGGSYTILDDTRWLNMTPGATRSAFTLTMPAAPLDGQVVTVACRSFGVTTLTHSPNAGHTMDAALTTISPGDFGSWQFNSSASHWFRVG